MREQCELAGSSGTLRRLGTYQVEHPHVVRTCVILTGSSKLQWLRGLYSPPRGGARDIWLPLKYDLPDSGETIILARLLKMGGYLRTVVVR